MFPKISIVTVNLNNARFLEETIQSVLNQNYPNLEYIIIDGGSTDKSIEIIKKYEQRLAYWKSEKDEGYGHALQKGFEKSTGEIMAWLNSDDLYYPGSLFTAAEIFQARKEVKWLTGFPSWLSENGVRLGEMPNLENCYWKRRYDFYLKYSRWSRIRYLGGDYLAIQQESTFWKRDLWEKAGGFVSPDYKLAVDTELWRRFFRHEKLHTVPALLGAFREGNPLQITRIRRDEYFAECRAIIEEERRRLAANDKILLYFRFFLSMTFKPLYYFDLPLGGFYERILNTPALIIPSCRKHE